MSPSCTQNQACRLYMHIQELIKPLFNGLSTSDLYPLKHKALGWIWNSFFIYRIQILESVSLLTNLCKQKGNNLKISPCQLHRKTCREEIVLLSFSFSSSPSFFAFSSFSVFSPPNTSTVILTYSYAHNLNEEQSRKSSLEEKGEMAPCHMTTSHNSAMC